MTNTWLSASIRRTALKKKHCAESQGRKGALTVNIVSLRMGHHASASGYDRLADAIPYGQVIHTPGSLSTQQRIAGWAGRHWIRDAGLQWYHRENWVVEMELAGRWLRRRGEIFHYLYGENSFRYLGALRQRNSRNRLVATFHTPPERFREVVTEASHLASLDAAIVMSRVQIPELAKWLPEERIHFVPHGIDADYFSPGLNPGIENRSGFLCVGRHLRDFGTLRATAALLAEAQPSSTMTVVASKLEVRWFEDLPNVRVMIGVGDHELRDLYRSAVALVMPLNDATANNTLLEALACGLPILTTDLAGTRDYVNDCCACLLPKGDARAFADAATRVSSNTELWARMSGACLTRAVDLRWQRVSDQTVDLYKKLL